MDHKREDRTPPLLEREWVDNNLRKQDILPRLSTMNDEITKAISDHKRQWR